MNIGIVSLQFEETSTGGGGVHVENITNQFLKMGHKIAIMSIHTNKTINDIQFENDFDVPYSIEHRDSLTLIRFLIEEGIDQPYVGDKTAELNRIMRFAETAIEWIKKDIKKFDVINLQGHHIIPGFMARELKDVNVKTVSYLHALETTYVTEKGDFVGAYEGTSEVLSKIRRWESMCCFADVVIGNSPIVNEEVKGIISEFEKQPELFFKKIKLVASGCDEDFILPEGEIKEELANVPDIVNLITFCRIDPSKGVEYSIRGAKKAAELSSQRFCLTIAGIPSSEEYLRQLKTEAENGPSNLVVEFNIFDRISFKNEKKEILDDKHIYILPTLKEPFGMSLIEASARGNMIVSAETNGPQYMFESHSGEKTEWGIITDYGVLAEITSDHDRYFAENIGKGIVWSVDNWEKSVDHILNFNKKIREFWTWRGVAEQYIEIFENINS